MPGSWMSIRIRSGCSSRASVSPASASRRAEHGMARRLQQEDRQRHVGGVVLDDQDGRHVRPPTAARPTWRAGLRPMKRSRSKSAFSMIVVT